jgi:hypothetical protein
MSTTSEPNWLMVIGLVYVAYAFGLLALSAVRRGAAGDARSMTAAASKQRVCFAFAGIVGMVGALMQALGQAVHLGEGLAAVVMLLGLIVLLLGYLAVSERLAGAGRMMDGERLREPFALVSTTYGQAAE